MKKTTLFAIVLLFCSLSALAAQSVYVEDFTASQADIRALMTGATNVLRSALLQNTVAEFTSSRNNAAYIINGTVTRFGAIRQDDTQSGGMSGSANVSVQLFNFLAPSIQTGHIGSQNKKGGTAAAQQPDEPRVMVSAQLVETRTGRIAAAASISAVTWDDYLAKAAVLARELTRSLPFPQSVFSGVWEAEIEHSNLVDSYRINFRAAGQCGVTVSSADPSGAVNTQSADGRYAWDNEILRVTARFTDNTIAHLRVIDWRAVIRLSADRNSFTMTIPVSQEAGALRVGARFWKAAQ